VAAFSVLPADQIVMVTDAGQLIRCPVADISINGRTTRGVKLFATADGERVVSVSRIRDVEEGAGEQSNGRAVEDEGVANDGLLVRSGQEPGADGQEERGGDNGAGRPEAGDKPDGGA
jgi:hypothetical protein